VRHRPARPPRLDQAQRTRHVSNIFAKLGVSSRAAAVAEAAKRGIT
jgi:ATP/maltotriose-dependent transcriptional regulator MalT